MTAWQYVALAVGILAVAAIILSSAGADLRVDLDRILGPTQPQGRHRADEADQ